MGPIAIARFVTPARWQYTRADSAESAGRERVRTSAKAFRSIPSGRRPAPRTASTTRETIDSRAATTTMRRRAAPSGVTVSPITWWSSTTSSSGIAIASAAWNRTATASSSGSSILGSSRWRTTICWLDTPSRTRRGSPWFLKKSRRASLRAGTSVTSPSGITPGGSSALTAREIPSEFVCTAAMNSPSRSSPTIPRLLFFLPRAIAMRVPCKRRYRPLFATALAVEEGLDVEVDQLRSHDQRSEAAERQERRERDAALASRGAVAHEDRDADDGAREERDQQRWCDGEPEVEPHHARELHVAHAHPGRVRERCEQQERERRRARDQELRKPGRLDDGRGADGPDGHRCKDPVRHDAVLEVDDGDRNQHRRERQVDEQLGTRAAHESDEREDDPGHELDDRIARRDLSRAVTAAAAQDEPRQQRDVVERAHLGAAAGAARARFHDRLAARQRVGHDVQERADDEAERCDEGEQHLDLQRRCVREFAPPCDPHRRSSRAT